MTWLGDSPKTKSGTCLDTQVSHFWYKHKTNIKNMKSWSFVSVWVFNLPFSLFLSYLKRGKYLSNKKFSSSVAYFELKTMMTSQRKLHPKLLHARHLSLFIWGNWTVWSGFSKEVQSVSFDNFFKTMFSHLLYRWFWIGIIG